MKKVLFSIVMLFSVIMIFSSVSAVEISPADIPAGTYLISTHTFNRNANNEYNGTLTVKHIMLAAKTITGNKLSDMKILYKRASDNAWVDALTNEKVTLTGKVDIVYENTKVSSKVLYGDVYYNSKVERADETLLQSYTNGNSKLTEGQLIASDVNGDGVVNSSDSTAIMRYIDDARELTAKQLIVTAVNEDGDVDDLDHIIISKYVAHSITSLPYDSGNKYTITYNLDGGKTDESLFERYYGVYAEVYLPYTLPKPVKERFVFEGWTGSNGSTPQKDVTITSGTSGNLTYTANWRAE